MNSSARIATVQAPAKVNLCLEVLDKRSDGFHNLRTIFQTISLADQIEIEFIPQRSSRIELVSAVDIPDNIVVRAAELLMRAYKIRGHVRLQLDKKIPMGGGLGGGSTDAAAVLLALPVLAGRHLRLHELMGSASELGSDVPFFLLGGTVLGLGRGTELYPVSGVGAAHVLLLTPQVHSSTAGAYQVLGRPSAYGTAKNWCSDMSQAMACNSDWTAFSQNDFEASVFASHSSLAKLHRKLRRAGAECARMTGSGSALFGVFATDQKARAAQDKIGGPSQLVRFMSRLQYRRLWMRQLSAHVRGPEWPPQSRY